MLHTEGLDNDLQVTNEKMGELEKNQIASNTKLTGLESSVARVEKSLASLLRRFDELHKKENSKDEHANDNWEDDAGDTEQDDVDATDRRRLHHNRRGMGGGLRREVHNNNNDAFSKIKFKIPLFDGKYDPDAYITWEIAVDQKYTC